MPSSNEERKKERRKAGDKEKRRILECGKVKCRDLRREEELVGALWTEERDIRSSFCAQVGLMSQILVEISFKFTRAFKPATKTSVNQTASPTEAKRRLTFGRSN